MKYTLKRKKNRNSTFLINDFQKVTAKFCYGNKFLSKKWYTGIEFKTSTRKRSLSIILKPGDCLKLLKFSFWKRRYAVRNRFIVLKFSDVIFNIRMPFLKDNFINLETLFCKVLIMKNIKNIFVNIVYRHF